MMAYLTLDIPIFAFALFLMIPPMPGRLSKNAGGRPATRLLYTFS